MAVTSRGDPSEGPDPARRQRGLSLDLIDASPVPLLTDASARGGVTQVVDAGIASDPRFSRLGRARTGLPGHSSDGEARIGNPHSARSATSIRDASAAPYTACVKHAILGAGGVGGLIGAALARAGEDVVLLMREESRRASGGVMQVESVVLGDFAVDVRAAPVLEGAVDVLWVTPKATQLEPALTLAPPGVVDGARVVTLMNGVDHLRLLQSRYEHVIGGAIRVESERVSPGHIRQASPFIRVELSDGQDIVGLLALAGFEAELGPAAGSILWQKLAFLAPLALSTTAYDKTLGQVRQREDFQACQAETVAIAKAEGATLDIEALEALTSGAPAEMRSSMQKDKAKGLPLELDAIAGPIIRGGVAHEIATPATEHLKSIIEGMA